MGKSLHRYEKIARTDAKGAEMRGARAGAEGFRDKQREDGGVFVNSKARRGQWLSGGGTYELSDVVKAAIMDQAGLCVQEDCPMFAECSYPKEGKCGFEVEQMAADCSGLSPALVELGYYAENAFARLVVPQFRIIAHLRKYEMKMSDPFTRDAKGNVKAHPIFELKRRTMEAVPRLLKLTGIYELSMSRGLLSDDGEVLVKSPAGRRRAMRGPQERALLEGRHDHHDAIIGGK